MTEAGGLRQQLSAETQAAQEADGTVRNLQGKLAAANRQLVAKVLDSPPLLVDEIRT